MPLFLPFKRAGRQERVLQAVMIPVVAAMALFTLLPVLLSLAGSFGDPTDAGRGRAWPDPGYLFGGRKLYARYLAQRYDYWPSMSGFNDWYGEGAANDADTILRSVRVPEPEGPWGVRARDAAECLKERMNWTHYRLLYSGWFYRGASWGHTLASYTGAGDEAWKAWLKRAHGSIAAVNRAFDTEFAAFAYVKVPGLPDPNTRGAFPPGDPWVAAYCEFLERGTPPEWRLIQSGDRWYRAWLQARPEIGTDLGKLVAATGVPYKSWAEVGLAEVPPTSGERRLWESYVRETLSGFSIGYESYPEAEEAFRRFLLVRHGSEPMVAAAYATSPVNLAAAASHVTRSATALADWEAFARVAPAGALRVRSPEVVWRRFLAEKYKDVEAVNRAHGARYASLAEAPWPQVELDRWDWQEHRLRHVARTLFQNYRRIWGLMTDASPALLNTLRFSILFTLLAVLVNAAAGYALSRFPLRPLQVSLVLFLALAAFPLEAIAVPNFLLLRGYGLLNTVWALVLPTAVNGYFLYLMKGTFDALPKSYVEAATLEGAGEWDVFWRVALPAASPMLAVVALFSFLWSYANFMWAFIVCQQRTQWTLPVMLFSMTNWAPFCVLAAGAVTVMLPPLVVFAFAHRVVQRGLTLPRG